MTEYDLVDLITMRESILSKQESSKQKEIVDKLDDLILAELKELEPKSEQETA